MRASELVSEIIIQGKELAKRLEHEYITPEHLVYVMCQYQIFVEVFEICGGDVEVLQQNLGTYLEEELETVADVEPIESFMLQQALILASQQVLNSGKKQLEIDHLIATIIELPECFAAYYLLEQGVTKLDLIYEFCHMEVEEDLEESLEDFRALEDVDEEDMEEEMESLEGTKLEKYMTNLSEQVKSDTDPLIGREDILHRTVQVLCRRNKNNPIHIGEPGVGKTAITLGLAKLINEGKVPKILQGAEIYALDMGALLAGTQYRGDFEKRIKKVLDGLKKVERPIVYIDEIHNIVGAGALGAGSLDASNLLKPYLTEGKIRFIGATTFEEYRKYFEKDKGLVRRFQTIEVKEPSIEETIQILQGLKVNYEAYHGVTYTPESLEVAARLSGQYINDKFLPDKAIDLIDEAGAYMAMKDKGKKVITATIIEETIAKICHIPKQTVESNEMAKLKKLEPQLKTQIFGQDKAIEKVVKCIKMSRAGLGDEHKPVASMLFVGPTGVGKTEIAKCLAEDLGIKLIRFDMSEYTEKHTASKLIGAPAGYVGYEDGGLLTDAIRKTPHCVLLLDEIEKAHSDIFNMLLQVMDYATLTDNQGKKADFRNVILLMTSNAGASNIGKSLVGFGDRVIKGEAIVDEVKNVFTPEFRNRLNAVIAFNHITRDMAQLIADKELKRFKEKLQAKNIKISLSKKCIAHLADKGTSKEYGAREIARLVENELKPLLVDEILFGKLAKGGNCKVNIVDGKFEVKIVE